MYSCHFSPLHGRLSNLFTVSSRFLILFWNFFLLCISSLFFYFTSSSSSSTSSSGLRSARGPVQAADAEGLVSAPPGTGAAGERPSGRLADRYATKSVNTAQRIHRQTNQTQLRISCSCSFHRAAFSIRSFFCQYKSLRKNIFDAAPGLCSHTAVNTAFYKTSACHIQSNQGG